MGWLFMRDMGGHAAPRAYLDNQFTYKRDDHRLTVLASSMVGTTYYAACERVERTDDRQVFDVVCLTKHNPLERHLRDALCVRVHPPQEDTVLVASGRRVLGV